MMGRSKHMFLQPLLLLGVLVSAGMPTAGANDLAELPHWPIGLGVPEGAPAPKRPVKGGAILAWIPPKAERIRAVLLIRQNTDSKHFGEHVALRRVASRHEMAVVYLRYYPHLALAKNPRDRVLFQILDLLAKETGIREFRHAPWITFGKSSVGKFTFYPAWAYPERTIATISYHAETPTWPPEPWARIENDTILHVSLNGETEWGGTWNRHVRPSLLNYRARTNWLPQLAVAHDVGHGNYLDVNGGPGWGRKFPGKVTCIRVWDYLSLFVDKALALRLPEGSYPTQGPVKLRQVDPAAGFLIRPYAIEDLFDLPRIPMTPGKDGYEVDPAGEEPPATFVAVPPADGYAPPAGTPVEPLAIGRCPSRWLLTEGFDFAMKDDPMQKLGTLATLRPGPGQEVSIDGRQTAFVPIRPKYMRREGGITLNNGLQTQDKATLLAYTVLDVDGRHQLRLNAPFTQNGRVQVILNGTPIAHGQILELEKGLYPMLVVVRLRTKWSSLRTSFEEATPEEIRAAKLHSQEVADREGQAKDVADGSTTPQEAPVMRKFTNVPEADRANWFWVADRELAEAWLKLHQVKP